MSVIVKMAVMKSVSKDWWGVYATLTQAGSRLCTGLPANRLCGNCHVFSAHARLLQYASKKLHYFFCACIARRVSSRVTSPSVRIWLRFIFIAGIGSLLKVLDLVVV